AELPGGDLLCVFRRTDPKSPGREARWQGRLSRQGGTRGPRGGGPAPLPPHGPPRPGAAPGRPAPHPAPAGGPRADGPAPAGDRLNIPGTTYYPRSVQARDGTIHVFGHVGGDDPYGKVDQSIVMDRFRLESRPAK